MARSVYLVSYDVADDRRRDRIFKTLRDEGDHVQYSVFICSLSDRELATLRGQLDSIVHHEQDQVMILSVGGTEDVLERSLDVVGRPYRLPVRVRVV